MNRSIAKTRNQLQRITLKINQLKTKYTGDVYMHSNPTLQNSPISSHTPSQNANQFRQSQKQYQRPRQFREGVSFISKPIQMSGSKNYNQSNSQLYSQNQCQSQPQIQTYLGNEELYQKQFKIFRNEIYSHIQRCLGVNKQKQQQIIQKTLQKYSQKQKLHINQSTKSKSNLQQRIKKIQQQTTNCLTNIQDLLIQVKKNQKYTNEKITNLDTRTKKQLHELNLSLKSISASQADTNAISLQQLNKKLITIQKLHQQYRQESIKQTEKINTKIQNLENGTNKKISQKYNLQQELITKRSQALHQDITKYQQFNIMLQKQILELKTKQEQFQLSALQNQQSQSVTLSRIKEQITLEFQQKINLLEENVQKNLTDMASVAETLLSLENRFQQNSTSQANLRQIVQTIDKKMSKEESDGQTNKSPQVLQLLQKQKLQVLEQLGQKLLSKISIQVQERLKMPIETVKKQLSVKINEQILKEMEKADRTIQSSLLKKLSIIINQHEEQIIEKIVQTEQNIIKVQQIQHMFNDFKNKLCEQIETQVSHSLAIHEQSMIQKIKNQDLIASGLSLQGVQEIEASISHKIMQQVQEKIKNMGLKLQTTLSDQYTQMKKDKLNNHHDGSAEQKNIEIQNKVLQDIETINAHIVKIQQKIAQICNHLEANEKLLPPQAKQSKEDCNTQTLRRNDTLQSSQIGSQNPKYSPKTEQIGEQKKVIEVVEQKLSQFQNDINETIKLLYEDIQNKVNDVVNNSGIVEFRTHFEIFKSELSSLSTLVNSLILTKQTKNQQHQHKNIQNQLKIIKNQIYRNSSQIYSEMSVQIAKISTILQKTCQEVELKVQKLDRNFSYTYERLSNIQYDNAHFKDKLTFFLSSKPTNTDREQIKLIIEPKSQNKSNILDILGKFSVGKPEVFETN